MASGTQMKAARGEMNEMAPKQFALIPIFIASLFVAACTPKPPDVPVCKPLEQRFTTDPITKHTILTPSPACMKNIGEPSCGYCVWIVSGQGRFIGEVKKLVPLRELQDTGKKDAANKPIYDWEIAKNDGKIVMVSTWLNDKKPWNQVLLESMSLPAEESYAPLSTYIINSCEKMHCDDQVTRFKVKLDSLNGISGAIKN